MIYFDNAATTMRKPDCVIQAVAQAMEEMGNSGRAAHDGALYSARTIFRARQVLADFFGCPKADHVVFTANVTEALNLTLFGLLSPKDHVITTDAEHNSVLRPLYRLAEQGVEVDFLPVDALGNPRLELLERYLRPNTRLVVTTHASNLTGNLVDIAAVGKFCRAHGLCYVVDSAQTAGSLPIHMERQHIDVLCFTGHKGLLGPQGTGGLCIRPGVEIPAWKVGGTGVQTYLPTQPIEYPVRLEAGTLNGHGIAGLLAAVEYIRQVGRETIHNHEMALMRQFLAGVRAIDGVTVYGDFSGDRAPIVTVNLAGWDSGQVADILAEDYEIAVRPGAHCAPRLHKALGTVDTGAVRFSFGWSNTREEVETALVAIRSIMQ